MGIQINGQTDTISAFDNNFSLAGNVSIGGTLTYEDVTNVDAVGLSTFQAGIHLDDSITHLGDTNTKIRFPAADTITAETGGSERLRIDSSGNVGIDQATPSSFGKFVVNGTGNIISLTSSSGAGSLSFFEGGTGRFYIKTLNGSDGLSFVDGDGSSERLRITSDGKIGVNESNPGCLSGGIHLVHSDAEGTPTFTGGETAIFQRNFNSAQSSEISIVSGTASKSTINFGDKDDVNIGMIQYENNNNAFVFTTNTSERLRITSGGLLGIGTDNPGHLLDLYNSDGLDCLRLNVNGSAGGSSKQNAIRFSVDDDIKAHMGLAVDAGRLISGSIANDFCLKGLGSNNILFATNSSERLRITSDGKIGINETSPDVLLHLTETNADPYNTVVTHLKLDNGGGNENSGSRIELKTGVARCWIQSFIDGANSNSGGALVFGTPSSGTLGTERLRITSGGDTEIRNIVSSITNSYSQYLKFRTTQTNGQSAITGQIAAQGKSSWGGDLVFYTKPANGSPTGANSEHMRLNASGETTFLGNIILDGDATATNQNRRIYWTGFDKESTSDYSDFAYIQHTTNTFGITGSVLEIKAANDSTDGIALNAAAGSGQICLNGNIRGNIEMHNYGGRIRPSYGTGDKGISWQPDPAGGSGDSASIQYYTDGSGEDTRLRISITNDAQDDLRLEGNSVHVQGTFTAASNKGFRIPHVLAGLTTTTDLVHTAVEGPQADLIYRGRAKLVAGISTVNIDITNNMTDGTFVNLNRDVQCFTSNETGWTAVKGSVTGNLLTIIAQDNTCTDTISWMVVGERWDLAMYDPKNPMTAENGKLKTEIPNSSYNKGGDYEQDYINDNKFRVGISTISRPSIENKEVE